MPSNSVPATDTRTWLSDHATADKAIIALTLARAGKRPGDTGVGANRDDIPLFDGLVNEWSKGNGGDKETIMRARARVMKYGRQLQASVYYHKLRDPTVGRQGMIDEANALLQKYRAERELLESLRLTGTEDYGNW